MSIKYTEQLERWRRDAEKVKPDSAAASIAKSLLRAIEEVREAVESAGDGPSALAHMSRPSQLASDMYEARLREMAPPKP